MPHQCKVRLFPPLPQVSWDSTRPYHYSVNLAKMTCSKHLGAPLEVVSLGFPYVIHVHFC